MVVSGSILRFLSIIPANLKDHLDASRSLSWPCLISMLLEMTNDPGQIYYLLNFQKDKGHLTQ